MEKQNKKSINCLKYICLAIFAFVTIAILFLRDPFWDEANSWMIAKSFSLFDLITKVERYDGHLFLWHIIQMPFAKLNLFYPGYIYTMNWLFCFVALVIFWNRAPFSNFHKVLITFSYPFVFFFATVARCYSIGVLFLFIILSFWNKKVCRPILFSFLIVLLANTSGLALAAAAPLGLIFVADLFKSNTQTKNKIIPLFILAAGAAIVLTQLLGANIIDHINIYLDNICAYFFYFNLSDINSIFAFQNIINGKLVLFLFFLGFFYFRKSKRALIFYIFSFGLLNYIFLVKYCGNWWHYTFFFIYFIASIWLYRLDFSIDNSKLAKFFNFVFSLLLLSFCAVTLTFPYQDYPYLFNSKSALKAQAIKEKGLFKENYKIYTLDSFSELAIGILPYFTNIDFYDIFGNKKYSFENYKHNGYSHVKPLNIDILVPTFDKNKINVGITTRKIETKYTGENYTLDLVPIYTNDGQEGYFAIYEMKWLKK